MATFVAKNSGEVKKKPMIILKEFIFFVLVSISGGNDWHACEDSHWNKNRKIKIVIYNPWTWKQSENTSKISLTPKRSEFTGIESEKSRHVRRKRKSLNLNKRIKYCYIWAGIDFSLPAKFSQFKYGRVWARVSYRSFLAHAQTFFLRVRFERRL